MNVFQLEFLNEQGFCLFVLGFNVSLTLFQSYCTCMRQVIVLPHWNAPVAGTGQEHPTQSHYKMTPGRPAIFPSTHLSMPSVSKGASCTIFLRLLICRRWGSIPQPFVPQANALPLNHLGLFLCIYFYTCYNDIKSLIEKLHFWYQVSPFYGTSHASSWTNFLYHKCDVIG